MLKAGFARLDITPPLGTHISGYFHERRSKGVLDPLELNALAVSDGESTALVIVCDIIGIKFKIATKLREGISKRTGVPMDHILITALHQHTSFALRVETGDETMDKNLVRDPAYLDVLYRKFEDVAVMALSDMEDAVAETASGETPVQLSFVRRYVMKNGPVATNPGRLNPDLVRPASDPDNTVRLIRFRRASGRDIAYVNFSTHPDVIGGEKNSADWPGFVRKYFEASLDGISCICGNGAQGDVNHIDFFKAKQWDDRYEYSRFMGKTIADTAVSLWDKTEPHKDGKIFGEVKTVYSRTRTEGEERYDECKAFCDAYNAGTLGYKPHITEIAAANRIVMVRRETIYRAVPVSVIGIGDIALVGFGGEPFTVYATNARNAAPDKFVVAACCANGYEGYLPSACAFSEGGYESSSSLFTSAIEQECADAAKELLSKF